MDFLAPFHSKPEPIPSFDVLAGIEQWARLTIGSMVAYTALAPALRGITLRMTERDHRRAKRWIAPSPQGPFLPFTSTREAIKQTWQKEGFKGWFRGMGSLYVMAPIRAAFHLNLLNYIESNALPTPVNDTNAIPNINYQGKMEQALGLNSTRKDSNSTTSLASFEPPTRQVTLLAYLCNTVMLVILAEVFLYPTRFLYVRMAGDLLSTERTIHTNRSWRLFTQTIKAEGVLGLYKGFTPSLLAVAIPAAAYAYHRFDLAIVNYNRRIEEQRNPRYVEEDNSSAWSAVLRQAKSTESSKEPVSAFWLFSCLLTYPLISVSVSMASSNLPRTAESKILNSPAFSASWAKWRDIFAKIFPSTSKASSASLSHTIRRVSSWGLMAAFAAVWTSLAARASFESITRISADLIARPFYALYNQKHYKEWTFTSPRERQNMLDQELSDLAKREEALRRLLQDTSASPSAPLHPASQDLENIDMTRYEDGDNALAVLGLSVAPIAANKPGYFSSSSPSTSFQPAATTSLNITKLRDHHLIVTQEDMEALKKARPSSRSSSTSSTSQVALSTPTISTSPTNTQTDDKIEIKAEGTFSRPSTSSKAASASSSKPVSHSSSRPLPLLSQKKQWYADFESLSEEESKQVSSERR